jgi:hypothetical protein
MAEWNGGARPTAAARLMLLLILNDVLILMLLLFFVFHNFLLPSRCFPQGTRSGG